MFQHGSRAGVRSRGLKAGGNAGTVQASRAQAILQMQKTYGNRATIQMLSAMGGTVQRTVSFLEKKADKPPKQKGEEKKKRKKSEINYIEKEQAFTEKSFDKVKLGKRKVDEDSKQEVLEQIQDRNKHYYYPSMNDIKSAMRGDEVEPEEFDTKGEVEHKGLKIMTSKVLRRRDSLDNIHEIDLQKLHDPTKTRATRGKQSLDKADGSTNIYAYDLQLEYRLNGEVSTLREEVGINTSSETQMLETGTPDISDQLKPYIEKKIQQRDPHHHLSSHAAYNSQAHAHSETAGASDPKLAEKFDAAIDKMLQKIKGEWSKEKKEQAVLIAAHLISHSHPNSVCINLCRYAVKDIFGKMAEVMRKRLADNKEWLRESKAYTAVNTISADRVFMPDTVSVLSDLNERFSEEPRSPMSNPEGVFEVLPSILKDKSEDKKEDEDAEMTEASSSATTSTSAATKKARVVKKRTADAGDAKSKKTKVEKQQKMTKVRRRRGYSKKQATGSDVQN